MATHRFEAHLVWQKGQEGVQAGNHTVEVAGRPALGISAAPQYRGDAAKLNPEELFLASLTSCQMLTYLALAHRAGLDVLAYEDRSEAILAMAERKMRVTEVHLRPKITIAAGGEEARARSLVETAHEGCFIANSVACAVHMDPEIVVQDAS
jgi:organic hydroperoxide reductase OsmC/OhrA